MKHEFCKSSLTSELRCLLHPKSILGKSCSAEQCAYVTNFKPVAYHHKTIVKGFVLLSRAEFKCFERLNCYQGQSSLFEGIGSQLTVDDYQHL